jgi:hypothetical protein
MDKVSMKSSQAMPLWERNKASRGHRSAVDGALKAHRERRLERQQRVQDRIDADQFVQKNEFFPKPQMSGLSSQNEDTININSDSYYGDLSSVAQAPSVQNQSSPSVREETVMNDTIFEAQPEVQQPPQYPKQMEDLFAEAQLGSVKNQALSEVEQELENPERQGPVEDMPKGSYVDYEV